MRAADQLDDAVPANSWIDPAAGRITFKDCAENARLPARQHEQRSRRQPRRRRSR